MSLINSKSKDSVKMEMLIEDTEVEDFGQQDQENSILKEFEASKYQS